MTKEHVKELFIKNATFEESDIFGTPGYTIYYKNKPMWSMTWRPKQGKYSQEELKLLLIDAFINSLNQYSDSAYCSIIRTLERLGE